MRTIKFRVWDEKLKEMSDGEPLGSDLFWDTNRVFMQFTGLKDKNGKEIYEEDIVEYLGLKLPIGFMRGHFIVYKDFVGHEDLWKAIDRDPNLEVIGNIYENPELLIK